MKFLRPSQIIILVVCINIGVAFFFLVRFLLTDIEAQTLQATEEIMVDTSIRLAEQVEYHLGEDKLDTVFCLKLFPMGSKTLDREIKIYDLHKKEVGLNYYITNADGVVVFDSDRNSRLGENYSYQNDVYKTLRGEYGARSSRVDEEDQFSSVMYVGAPIMRGGKVSGVLTVYKPQLDVMPFVADRKKQVVTACVLFGTGLIILVAGVFFWVYRPIGKLTNYAEDVIDGGRPSFPKLGRGREINTLGVALKKMREALEGRAYARNYVQTLSHELKSPISAIKASAELLQEDMPEDRRAHFLGSILTEANRSERVISRLQQLSMMEEMSELERRENVSLVSILKILQKEYEPIAKRKNVEFVAELEDITYSGDTFLLRAAFQNLIDNALKFAPESSKIELSLRDAPLQVVFVIKNGGTPIPAYARDRVYERLFSLGNEGKEKGSGIGLSLVKEAVELHRGKVVYHYAEEMNVFEITLMK